MGKKINDPSIPSGLGQVDGSYLMAVAHPTTGKIYRLPVSLLIGLFKTVTANYTLLLSDWGGNVEVDSASAVNITVPAGLPASFFCSIWQKNTGTVTIVAGSGTTLRGALTLGGQNSVATIVARAQDDFYVPTGGAGSGTTGGGTTQLGTPTVTFGATDASSIVVNWSTVTSATNYVVKRNTSNTITGATQIFSGGLLTFTDTGLTAGTTYYYFVIAQATGFTDSNAGTGSHATNAGSAITGNVVNFGTVPSNLTNTSGVWSNTDGSGAASGVGDTALAFGTVGEVWAVYTATDARQVLIGFADATFYNSFQIGGVQVYSDGGLYLGGTLLQAGIPIGSLYGQRAKADGSIVPILSTDGSTWVEFTGAAGGTRGYRARVEILSGAARKLYNPKRSY